MRYFEVRVYPDDNSWTVHIPKSHARLQCFLKNLLILPTFLGRACSATNTYVLDFLVRKHILKKSLEPCKNVEFRDVVVDLQS